MRALFNTLIVLSLCGAVASCGHRPNDDRGNLETLWRTGDRDPFDTSETLYTFGHFVKR